LYTFLTVNAATNCSYIEELSLLVNKEKSILEGSMYFNEIEYGILKGHIWVPNRYETNIKDQLDKLKDTGKDDFIMPSMVKIGHDNLPPALHKVPTFIKTNDVTGPFQF